MNKAHGALAAEKAAAEAEGIFEPTADQRAMLKRYKELKERTEKAKAEMDAIATTVLNEMEEAGATALAVNGKNWVLITQVNQKKVDTAGLEQEYPELTAQYREAVAKFTRSEKVVRKTVKPA